MELQQSPFLSLISDRQVQQTLALMGQPKEARLTPDVAQQICERTASAVVLEGSIASLGSQYVLGLRARNCSTGDTVDQEQVQVARREDVLNSLSQIARKFRTRVGESLSDGGKALDAARRGDDTFTRSPEGVQHRNEGGLSSGNVRGHTLLPARGRDRSQIRDGARHVGALVQRCWRVGAVSREHDQSLAIAGSRQRSGKVLHRLYLRSAGDGKSGKGVPNPRVVASDLSSRREQPKPAGVCWAAFPPTGQADLNERSRHPKKQIAAIPTLRFGMRSLASELFLHRPFRRSREHASTRLRAQAGDARFPRRPIQHRGA